MPAMTDRKKAPPAKPKAAKPPLGELQNTSLALQAREAILSAILGNEFDGKLPSEDVLAEMLNVSRTTVRAAVQDLERDGLITRRRAVGTTINQHVGPETLALQRLVGFDWLLREKGHEVEVDISWERRTPDEAGLDLPWSPAPECWVIDKNYVADGRLAIAIRDYIPWESLKVHRLPASPVPSLFELSRKYCREPIAHAVVQIIPMVNAKGVTRLDLPPRSPFIRLHELHYDPRARPAAWSAIDFDDSVLRLEVFRGQ
jgi:GntR family transcriptional regulator